MTQTKLPPGLYIVATPIGNLGDITFRAAEVLKHASVIAVEDTRVSGKLLKHIGSDRPMIRYDEHNAAGARPEILRRAALEAVALISDAGTPLVSDPGYKLVAEAHDSDVRIWSVPGPCAAIAALTLSGLPTDRFLFAGFLPAKQAARRASLAQLKSVDATLIFYESARRLGGMLADAHELLGDRDVRIVREITKLHEEYRSATLGSAGELYGDAKLKGEIVVVVAPPGADAEPGEDDIDQALIQLMADRSLKSAVNDVTAKFNLPRSRIYERALALKKDRS